MNLQERLVTELLIMSDDNIEQHALYLQLCLYLVQKLANFAL